MHDGHSLFQCAAWRGEATFATQASAGCWGTVDFPAVRESRTASNSSVSTRDPMRGTPAGGQASLAATFDRGDQAGGAY